MLCFVSEATLTICENSIDPMLQTKRFHFQWVRYPGGSCSPIIRSQMLNKERGEARPVKS